MIGEVKDLTGQTFGELLVIDLAGFDRHSHAMWLCQCSCGTMKVIRGTNMRARKNPTVSCRHVQRAMAKVLCGKLMKDRFGKDHSMFGHRDSDETLGKKSIAHKKPFDLVTAKQLRALGWSYRRIARTMKIGGHDIVRKALKVA